MSLRSPTPGCETATAALWRDGWIHVPDTLTLTTRARGVGGSAVPLLFHDCNVAGFRRSSGL